MAEASANQLVQLGLLCVKCGDAWDELVVNSGMMAGALRITGRVFEHGRTPQADRATRLREGVGIHVARLRDLADALTSVAAGLTILYDLGPLVGPDPDPRPDLGDPGA